MMPNTMHYVKKNLLDEDINRDAIDVEQSEWNVQLAQAYIEHLQQQPVVNHQLLQMLAAYNAGIGTLMRWQKNLTDIQDPLLWMERLPSPETRNYLKQVLAAYWMYQLQMGVDTHSRDALNQQKWPQMEKPIATEK